jgi:hypothetical protein
MRVVVLVLSLAAIAAVTPAASSESETGAAEAAAPSPTEPADTQVVCRHERLTGSRVPTRRICKTMAEWNKADRGRGSGAMTDNPGVTMRPGTGLPSEGAPRTPGN